MLKKTITYTETETDIERTSDFYFNLTTAELTALEVTMGRSLSETVKDIPSTSDQPAMFLNLIKKIVSAAYGIRDAETGRFIKSEKETAFFLQSEAYSELLVDLIKDPVSAAEFFVDIMPKAIRTDAKVREMLKEETNKAQEKFEKLNSEDVEK